MLPVPSSTATASLDSPMRVFDGSLLIFLDSRFSKHPKRCFKLIRCLMTRKLYFTSEENAPERFVFLRARSTPSIHSSSSSQILLAPKSTRQSSSLSEFSLDLFTWRMPLSHKPLMALLDAPKPTCYSSWTHAHTSADISVVSMGVDQ